MTNIQVLGIGAHVPEHIVTNDDLLKLVDTTDEWITTRTGIKERRIISGDESIATLGADAARQALACADIEPAEIDLILVATSTPDTIYPMACAQIQAMLGIPKAAGFDLTVACTGFTVALVTAHQFLKTGMYKNALVIGSDIHSRVTDWTDRNTCILFGDGAGALVLSNCGEGHDHILAGQMNLDGPKGSWLNLKTTLSNAPMVEPRTPVSPYIHMNGRDVFKFAVTNVPDSIQQCVAAAGLTLVDIDYIVLHQANTRIIQAIAEKLNLPLERFILDMAYYGNTSAASIPIAMHNAMIEGQLKPGHKVVMCGFGAGLSWSTAVVDWTCVDHRSNPTRVGNAPKALPAFAENAA